MIQGSKESPIHNPCFVVQNWNVGVPAQVALDGRPAKPGEVRQGITRSIQGKPTLVLWLERKDTGPLTLQVTE